MIIAAMRGSPRIPRAHIPRRAGVTRRRLGPTLLRQAAATAAAAPRVVMAVAAVRGATAVESPLAAEILAAGAIRAVVERVTAAGEGARTAVAGGIRIANPRF